jgi:glucokinase
MFTVACDMGGTRIKLGLVKNSELITTDIIPAHSGSGLKPRLPVIAETIQKLCIRTNIKVNDCLGIGIASPGVISQDNTRIVSINEKYSDAPSLDLVKWAEEEFGIPLYIENDARMATIGEWKYGAGKNCSNVVMITLGTGLGTSAVVNGLLLRGSHGIAGLLGGHFTINIVNGRKCTCGNIGCSEIEASTVSLNELAHEYPGFSESALSRYKKIEYAEVFKHAEENDPCAQYLLKHSLKIWAVTALNLVHAYDPELLILGGGIMSSADIIIPSIQEYLDKYTWNPFEKTKVVRAMHGNNAALLACEWLIKTKLKNKKREIFV